MRFKRSKNVSLASDLPPSIYRHPYLSVPGGVLFIDGRPIYCEGEISLMDGQTDGEVSFLTIGQDDLDNEWTIAFTFPLDEYMNTPPRGLDWQAHISDWICDENKFNSNRKAGPKASFNPKRDTLPAFASAETGGEYPLSTSGFKRYLEDYGELHYIEGSRTMAMRFLKENLKPVPGFALDFDVGDIQDSLEVLR